MINGNGMLRFHTNYVGKLKILSNMLFPLPQTIENEIEGEEHKEAQRGMVANKVSRI
jgi:hypothetical protein